MQQKRLKRYSAIVDNTPRPQGNIRKRLRVDGCGNIIPHILKNGFNMAITDQPPKTTRRGNYKAGPGRPPGRKNNHTIELERAVNDAASKLADAFEGDAHAFLATVYKNPAFPIEIRILAAGKALRVEKPVLSSVHGRMDVNVDIAARLQAARMRLASHKHAPIIDVDAPDLLVK